ncbi:putative peptide modification system cyclase [Marilutibacter alkalisoli]|uniref:Putative peptide modification system cyclase n=1 Tax=Marilutibacter alkalisoli TaxID=2591633 RepID=A0A514BVD8_9GAMM|nr:putative peptide modification system cyclase [Lysobacter alkalisoli]QDH71368.1 putative peptide modification system cyclase [Lysobacter alkalisoli]
MEDAVVLQSEPQAESAAPLLRTILLADICDSTNLVERLGDGGAAQFFREHDRLVLRLQQQWRGRLIDRADGLLLLFERPVDGLGFALDYARGLADIGKLRHLDIKTRSGLHVGEVLTWRNSDEAVRLGAKPIEVEGLAKPIAARLMSIARPGQILMSAVAEPLAHRSARELGERGQNLVWKSHGLWQFKGVAERQLVFEVGEPGLAPLRAPGNSSKAWRRLPLWRRPAALMAEAAVLVAVTFGAWFATRTPPAIAFNERDWVVVGDLRNLTGDIRLEDSLEQAFRISLEQSRHVNVLSDLKVRDSLARMRLEPGTVVDRDIASQIAQRDGARAVILPTVSEIGGRLRFSVEVVDPLTQTTVYARAADGRGEESVLASIDQVTGSVRANLGEAVKQIEHDSKPLPEVTTDNIDALRAYALGQKAFSKNDYLEADSYYQKATEIDPEFALAWLARARAGFGLWDIQAAVPSLRKAQSLRERLVPKEAQYLDGWVAEFDEPQNALAKWRMMATLYPDNGPAQANVVIRLVAANRFSEALPFANRATSLKYELIGNSFDQLGRVKLGLEDFEGAGSAFDQALTLGNRSSLRRRANVEAAQYNFPAAEKLLEEAPVGDAVSSLDRISIAMDKGKCTVANETAKRALTPKSEVPAQYLRALQISAATVEWLCGDAQVAAKSARSVMRDAMDAAEASSPVEAPDDIGIALIAGLLLQRLDDDAPVDGLIDRLEKSRVVEQHDYLRELRSVLLAEWDRKQGRYRRALERLEPLVTGYERYQTRQALLEAYAETKRLDLALEQVTWLAEHRGLAYLEQGCAQCQQALNVADSNLSLLRAAELLESEGHDDRARQYLARFDEIWPPQVLPPHLRTRRSALRAASN